MLNVSLSFILELLGVHEYDPLTCVCMYFKFPEFRKPAHFKAQRQYDIKSFLFLYLTPISKLVFGMMLQYCSSISAVLRELERVTSKSLTQTQQFFSAIEILYFFLERSEENRKPFLGEKRVGVIHYFNILSSVSWRP